tara:strand:+ start:85298 stop:85492 length:195 start_codon:yes stop_codon:yes gene_type:complete
MSSAIDDFEKELVNDTVSEDQADEAIAKDEPIPNVEISFGKGASRKNLLCSRGFTLKSIYDMSK